MGNQKPKPNKKKLRKKKRKKLNQKTDKAVDNFDFVTIIELL